MSVRNRRLAEISEEDCTIMALLDRQYLARPYFGSRWMAAWLGDPGPCRQPQTGPAPDAARRAGGDLPAAEHQQAGTGAQDLPLPARRHLDRAGQLGLVRGRHLHPDGSGLSLPGGDHGLGEPCACWRGGCRTRSARSSASRPSKNALSQHGRPEIFNTDQGSQFTSDDFTGTLERPQGHDQHGRQEMLWGERRGSGTFVAVENRRGAPCRSRMT